MRFSVAGGALGLVLAPLLVSSPAPLCAQESQNQTATASTADTTPTAEMVAQGKALYAHDCSHCHGFNMVTPGTIAYDLRTFPHNDKARFINSVTFGKNGRMPPWGGALSSAEMDEIWAYVLTGGKT